MTQGSTLVAASTHQLFLSYCREHDLDPRKTRYVRSIEDIMGHCGGTLIILPGFAQDWQYLVIYGRSHEMEVRVL